MFDFKQFPVYRLTESINLHLLEILSNKKVPRHLANQLDRASTSILLNIGEGAGKYGSKDKRSFYAIAKGSAQECVAILDILKQRDIISSGEYETTCEELATACKMLSGLIKRFS